VSRSQRQLKPHTPGHQEAALPREMASESVCTYASDQARHGSTSVQRQKNPPLRTVSAWRDSLVTVLLGIAACGILAYFLGWFMAIAVMAAVIVALALCLNSVINHTIEF
jgi:hypothetical protein